MPLGRNPLSARRRNATAWDAVRFSMSTAPRPHTNPSTISAPNGSRLHPSGFTGTTSVWPIKRSEGALGSVPSIRVTRLVRPGCGSNTSWSPAPARYPASSSTLRVSSPDAIVPSFTHWLRMSCCRRSVTSAVGSSARVGITTPLRPPLDPLPAAPFLLPFLHRVSRRRGRRARRRSLRCRRRGSRGRAPRRRRPRCRSTARRSTTARRR